ARGGQIGLAMTTSEALVHPWGGRDALIGSNPVAIAVPASPEPLVMDMATSAVSMGKIIDYANRGVPLQPGWALDAEGQPTTDAEAAKTGAIAPFGGPKGYALGIAFEALVGSLTASGFGAQVRGTLDDTCPSNKGDVFVVIQPPDGSRAEGVTGYLESVRSSPRQHPDAPIRVPGDRARAGRRASYENGFEVSDEVWDAIGAHRDRHGDSGSRTLPDRETDEGS
ncbi:MAG: Ldh family oxidoreductase, partial [Micromonosporaceae bacterium]